MPDLNGLVDKTIEYTINRNTKDSSVGLWGLSTKANGWLCT